MKFKIKVCTVNDISNSWFEEYDKNCENPQTWAEEVIQNFNSTLRTGEVKRQLLEVIIMDNNSVKEHSWRKTNLTTIIGKGMCYDTVKCSTCGITGKRFGLCEIIKIDPKYKAKVYQRCDTTKKQLEKLRNR